MTTGDDKHCVVGHAPCGQDLEAGEQVLLPTRPEPDHCDACTGPERAFAPENLQRVVTRLIALQVGSAAVGAQEELPRVEPMDLSLSRRQQ